MSALELRASLSLAGIFGLRMFGMFVILPVFAIYAERLPGGGNLMLVGLAIGAYGLTQAVFQIPFGMWSDRVGRRPVIYAGLAIFALGSFVAAAAPNIYWVIGGRVLQGAGAISAAVMALAADLTREENRTKTMAMIGSTIGATFALSLVLGPWLSHLIGVPGIFALTGALAIAAAVVVRTVVPAVPEAPRRRGYWAFGHFLRVLGNGQLARLNSGIFALHTVLMVLFIAVPFSLRDAGLPLSDHWTIYLPVMLGSFVLMLPLILRSGTGRGTRRSILAASVLLIAAFLSLPHAAANIWAIGVALLVFFTGFNVLEASLPSLVSRTAPARSKGAAIGIFSSVQFLGAFVGSAAGAFAYARWQLPGVVFLATAILVVWVALAAGIRVPERGTTHRAGRPPAQVARRQRCALQRE
jgi:MFS family permease